MESLRVGIDVGGTFTDFVFLVGDEVVNLKVPSTPSDPAKAIFDGLEKLGKIRDVRGIQHFSQGTTLAVNTLVQRNGALTALLVTKGFRDILEIGRQRLHDPNNYFMEKTRPLVARRHVREIGERLNAAGEVLQPIDLDEVDRVAEELMNEGVEAVAICFMHAYRNDVHERQALEHIRRHFPKLYACSSSEIWPEQREYERALVTVINAYVGPRMEQYFSRLGSRTEQTGIGAHVLSTRSNGGVMAIATARRTPVATLLSGPASGVIGANHISKLAGIRKVIGLDMGGTTAEVAIIDGEILYSTESTIGEFPLVVPAVDVSSIGAGGGSIAWVDDFGVLKVGPKSAGADPGPACYGRGGTAATITDAYLLAGIIDPARFAGGIELQPALAEKALAGIGARLGMSASDAASAILQVATANMYAQLMLLLARKGVDHREFALLAYGGAGPTHALLLAKEAGISKVVIPPSPGTVCALGALVADIKNDLIETVYSDLAEVGAENVARIFARLEADGREWLTEQKVPLVRTEMIRSADLRYKGQSFNLTVTLPRDEPLSVDTVCHSFHEAYRRVYGYADLVAPIEIINVRSTVIGSLATPAINAPATARKTKGPGSTRSLTLGRERMTADVYERGDLRPEQSFAGPALIEAPDTTVLVPPGFRATALASGVILVEET
jgi:N-methylhydantoinase A